MCKNCGNIDIYSSTRDKLTHPFVIIKFMAYIRCQKSNAFKRFKKFVFTSEIPTAPPVTINDNYASTKDHDKFDGVFPVG